MIAKKWGGFAEWMMQRLLAELAPATDSDSLDRIALEAWHWHTPAERFADQVARKMQRLRK